MTQYNVNDLFPEVNMFGDKSLMFVEEKNNNTFFALLAPSEYEGTVALARPVQSYFKGVAKKSKDYIIRCLFFGNPKNLSEAVPVGLVVNQFIASKLAETFKESDNELVERPNLLPDDNGNQFLFQLKKSGTGAATRVEIVFSKKAITVDPELLNVEFKSFAELIEEHTGMQEAQNRKFANGETKTPGALSEDVPF